MNINRRKLNNKGFTLIELLAVVVLLAIVMGLVASSVLNPFAGAKRTSLYTLSKKVVLNLNTWDTGDMSVIDASEKKLGQEFLDTTMTGEWVCFSDDLKINNAGSPTSLMKALGLSDKDIMVGTKYVAETVNSDGVVTSNPSCSAVRYNKSIGGYEVVLVAAKGGKYYVNGDKLHFAYSSAGNFNESLEQ